MTVGTPRATTFRVVRMDMSIFSPMQTTTMSQFCIPVSERVFLSKLLTTKAFSVYSRISRTFSSFPSITSGSAPAFASSTARAEPKRPSPIIP